MLLKMSRFRHLRSIRPHSQVQFSSFATNVLCSQVTSRCLKRCLLPFWNHHHQKPTYGCSLLTTSSGKLLSWPFAERDASPSSSGRRAVTPFMRFNGDGTSPSLGVRSLPLNGVICDELELSLVAWLILWAYQALSVTSRILGLVLKLTSSSHGKIC